MKDSKIISRESPRNHFVKRAKTYNHSANWVSDGVLIDKIYNLANPTPEMLILDIATGTGKIARAFYKKVKYVIGLDICPEMAKQAKMYADTIVLGKTEELPFRSSSFDLCLCRQGFQFMNLDCVFRELYRVLKPGGRIVSCHLTAYDKEDKELTFLIQKLRNPARKNFFLPQDFLDMFNLNNFINIEVCEYITRESINLWINNSTIGDERREAIREFYRTAPEYFKKLHNIEFKNGDIFDSMKMIIVTAVKAVIAKNDF